MTPEGRECLIRKGEQDLSEYVYEMWFQDNSEPEAEIKDILFGQANDLPDKGRISAGLEKLMGCVKEWSRLSAGEFMKTVPEDLRQLYAKERVANIIARFVYEQVADLVKKNPGGLLKGTVQRLFFRLPSLLEFNRRFKFLSHEYGETIMHLKRECRKVQEQINEAVNTASYSLLSYLRRQSVDLESYRAFKADAHAMQTVSALDSLVAESSGCNNSGLLRVMQGYINELEIRKELGEFMDDLISDYRSMRPEMFGRRCEKMKKMLESVAENPGDMTCLKLIGVLKKHRKKIKDSSYRKEILSGSSPVENFENPGLIKRWLEKNERNSNGFYTDEDEKRCPKEVAYIDYLSEMGDNHLDHVYASLADMLSRQADEKDANYWHLSTEYCMYVVKGGSRDILGGMDSESVDFKIGFLEVLNYNLDYGLIRADIYERKLRRMLEGAQSDENKFGILRKEQKTLEERRANIEERRANEEILI
jgi:hypothetical protein